MKKNLHYQGKALLAASTFAAVLTGCQSNAREPLLITPEAEPGRLNNSASVERQPLDQLEHERVTRAEVRKEELIYGTARYFEAPSPPVVTSRPLSRSDAHSFSFRDAPIDAVLYQFLGEGFGLNYAIDPTIQETLTLRLEGIENAEEAVSALAGVLRLRNIDISERSGIYIVARTDFAADTYTSPVFIESLDPTPRGASLAVLQLKHANVEEVTRIGSAMLPPNTIRYSDESRGFVVIAGQPDDVSSAVSLLKSLDVNWLSSVSTALIPIKSTRASEIASDLTPLLTRMGGVTIVPIDRLETLLVIARQRESLDSVRSWVARLDQAIHPQRMRDVLVYEARHVNAEDLLALTASGYSTPSESTMPLQLSNSPDASARPLVTERQGQPNLLSTDYTSPAMTMYSGLTIKVDPGRNAIVARGNSGELQSLGDLLALLDKPKRQVLIQATIVEVSLSDETSFGVQWDLVQNKLAARFTDSSSGAVSGLFPGTSISYINTDITAVLNALATTSNIEIVSSPRMLVLNNETARLQIGDQVPIITQSAISVTNPDAPIVNSTAYRDTGVILTVTPRIRAGGMVEIKVIQEVSGVAETTTSNIDSPTISQRSVESVLAVPDGATAVLGGLISSTRAYSETGIPLLKDTPLIGAAFRSTSQTRRRTELVVLIEPTVIMSETAPENLPASLRAALIKVREEGMP